MMKFFSAVAEKVARAAGHPLTFLVALASVVVWAGLGPKYSYSENWQLVINTSTTIVTFLMVFLIQNSQNRDGAALQAKLDEIIRAGAAQNSYIGLDHLSAKEIEEFRTECATLALKKVGDRAVARSSRKARDAIDEREGT